MIANTGAFSSKWLPLFFQKNKKGSPLENIHDLNELAKFLTSGKFGLDHWRALKSELKTFIAKHSDDGVKLDAFFNKITSWGVERNPEETMEIFAEIVSSELLTKAIQSKQDLSIAFHNVHDWAVDNAPFVSAYPTKSVKESFFAEWRRCRPLIVYFIPNLINVFLGAFNFLDPQKKHTTLWEKYLLVDIIYKFFSIPFSLIHLLKPVLVVSTKVYATAVIIIIATGVLLTCYLRWLKPLPDEIPNCTNLDKEFEKGGIEPKVGQIQEIKQLIAALEGDKHVLLVGRSGEGKTALVHHFIHLKHQQKLSKKIQNLAAFEVDCGMMISSVSYGHSDLINQIKDTISGFENKTLLFFDEFFQVAAKAEAFQAFKNRFLEVKPTKFIAAITTKEFEELKKIDKDGSFRRRITPIVMKTSFDDDENRLIIQDFIHRKSSGISVTEDAIDELLKVSKTDDYLAEIGRPAKALNILKDAIGLCRTVYNPKYESIELSQKLQEYEILKFQAKNQGKADLSILNKGKKIKEEIQGLEDELEKNKKHIAQIKKIKVQQKKMYFEYSRLTHKIAGIAEKEKEKQKVSKSAKNSKNLINQNDEIKYLWYYFYGLDAAKECLSKEIAQVASKHPVQVNGTLVKEVYKRLKENEQQLSAAGTPQAVIWKIQSNTNSTPQIKNSAP